MTLRRDFDVTDDGLKLIENFCHWDGRW